MPDMGTVAGHSGLAGAIVTTAVAITTFWLGMAATVWRAFLEPQRKRDAHKCEEDLRKQHDELIRQGERVRYLEDMLWNYRDGMLRQEMQRVASEAHIEAIRIRQEMGDKPDGRR